MTWPRRISLALAATIFAGALVSFFTMHAASAQFANGFDPAGTAVNFINNNNWLTQAQNWAREIYLGIIIFEVIALGITTLLFRDNLGEFFAGVAMKLLMGSIFFWFISVAGPGLGQLPGQVVTGTFGNTFGKGLGGTDDVAAIAAKGGTAAAAYFAASYGMRVEDGVLATVTEATTPVIDENPFNCTEAYAFFSGGGTCLEQPARTVAFGRQAAETVTAGLGLMTASAVAAIYLQYTMITIETYFVMTAGVLFLGFAGSRFTSQFSQGYFTYMISVGVKLMVFYIVLGLIGPMVLDILGSAIASLVGSIIDETGFVSLAAALFGALSVVICAGLVYAVPGLAASFLTGQSSVSGAALASQTMRSMAGGAQMMSQLASSSQARKDMVNEERSHSSSASNTTQHTGSRAHHQDTGPAHGVNQDAFAKSHGDGSNGALGNGNGNGQSNVLNDTLSMQSPPKMGSDRQSPGQIGTSSPAPPTAQAPSPVAQQAQASSGKAPEQQRTADSERPRESIETKGNSSAEKDRFALTESKAEGKSPHRETEAERDLEQSNQGLAYAAGAVAGAMPQETAPPAAVAIRVGTPDRL